MVAPRLAQGFGPGAIAPLAPSHVSYGRMASPTVGQCGGDGLWSRDAALKARRACVGAPSAPVPGLAGPARLAHHALAPMGGPLCLCMRVAGAPRAPRRPLSAAHASRRGARSSCSSGARCAARRPALCGRAVGAPSSHGVAQAVARSPLAAPLSAAGLARLGAPWVLLSPRLGGVVAIFAPESCPLSSVRRVEGCTASPCPPQVAAASFLGGAGGASRERHLRLSVYGLCVYGSWP